MNLQFAKMHGLGNDFVVVDTVNQSVSLTKDIVKKLACRHRGIGFDQLLVIGPARGNDHDFFYQIYNADGSEAYQCGNGARCIAKYIYDHKLSTKTELVVSTQTNYHQLIRRSDEIYTVDMGVPILEPEAIPFSSDKRRSIYTLNISCGDYHVSVVSMGNPHCIFETDNLNGVDLHGLGKTLSEHPQFPERTNVEFMHILAKDHIRLRIYERGVGETQACGSGACAAVVAGILQNKLASQVKVTMPGGDLSVEWQGGEHPVWITGPAEQVFLGNIPI